MGLLYNNTVHQCNFTAITDGIKNNGVSSGLQVTENSPAGMSVTVTAGNCEIDGVIYAPSSSQNISITNGDATYGRYDIITFDATADQPVAIIGTPAAVPKPPSIPAGDILLGVVYIAQLESTAITNSDIEEGRIDVQRQSPIRNVSVNTTALDVDAILLVDASGGAKTITLPTAVGNQGKTYTIKKTDSSVNAVTIDPNGSQTIDGALTIDLITQYDSRNVTSDGSNWYDITTVKPIDVFSPSVAYSYYNSAYSAVEGTWAKLNEITCGIVTDNLYIGYTWKGEATYTTDVQLKRNGVNVGTLFSSTSGHYITSKEEISGWSEGDTIEVWGYPHTGYHGNIVRNTYISVYLPSPYTFS